MKEHNARTRQIQQIPVFALRQVVNRLIDEQDLETVIRQRMSIKLAIKPRQLKRAVQRLSREQLTRLINACPEIGDVQVQELFEEYRYGSNPSFYIYLFNLGSLNPIILQDFQSRFSEELLELNKELEEGLPRLRRVELNDLLTLPERPEITEGTYRFQARLDYIDENQNAVSTYQTLYGFFWINTQMGYSIIQARSPEVLRGIARGIQAGADVVLYPLVITKEIKNALPFLERSSFRSGRLHDPNPESNRFRWLTIADDTPYEKGYEQYEISYPEVRSARYQDFVDDEKETSLTIRCDQGAFSLAGKLRASQFRTWCLDRLGKLIDVLNRFRTNLPELVLTQQLMSAPEMARFTPGQKEYVLKLISALLTIKQTPEIGEQPIGSNVLELAASLGDLVRVQVPYECAEPDCEEEAYLAYGDSDSTLFILICQDGQWALEYVKGHHQRITYTIPLRVRTELGHEFAIGKDELARSIEILPGRDLLAAIAATVNRRLPGYNFDPNRESFILRGNNLIYFPEPPIETVGTKNVFIIHQQIGKVERDGVVTGVNIGGNREHKSDDKKQ